MTIAINLTPVLVTLTICVFLYAMCKMARQDKEKEQPKRVIEVPEFVNEKPRVIRQSVQEYVESQVKKGEEKK